MGLFRTDKKQYLLLVILLAIILIIGASFVYKIKNSYESLGAEKMQKPGYLSKSVPSIQGLKEIIQDPKFKEMQYIKVFFVPITVTQKGRANPFMPFMKKDKEKEE